MHGIFLSLTGLHPPMKMLNAASSVSERHAVGGAKNFSALG